jgi:serine protease Do/serine protease DegQ
MKFSFKPRLHAAFVTALALALAAAAEGAASTPQPAKMPELKKDFSPVTDGKSGMITSYADIVDPVQKEVVSIESAKIVREAINPIMR